MYKILILVTLRIAALKDLKNLEVINVSGTKIRDLAPLKDLQELKTLNIISTQINDLSPLRKHIEQNIKLEIDIRLADFIILGTLSGVKTPLTNPPIEIAKQGNEAILRYWQEQDRVPCPCLTCADKKRKQEEPYFFKYSLLINDLRDGETQSDKCEFSRKRFPIREILKRASIRLFKIEQIKDLLTADKIEKALEILRGQFQDDDEVIVQLSRLTHSNRERLNGLMKENDYSVERNRIVKAVLEKLKEWEEATD